MLSRFPFPTEKGDKLRAFYQLQDLSKEWEIYLMCVTDEPISSDRQLALKPFCKELHIFNLNKPLIFFNVLTQFFTHKPFQYGYFFQHAISRRIDRLLHKIQPDHIFCQLIRAAAYVKDYHHCPKTLDYMDALSMGIKRRIETAPWWNRWLFRAEWRRLVRYESVLFDYFEGHTIISVQDRDFIQHPRKKEIEVIPNGVAAHFFEPIDRNEALNPVDVVFTGNMSYPPNVRAVQFIAEELIPAMKRRNKEITFLISGANPSPEVRKYSHLMEITGWVDDIRTSYSRAKLFIAPMQIGTGLQNKLLEAMACSIPCITTPLCNNALQASSMEIVLAETAEQFADKICELLDNPQRAKELGIHGQDFVRERYNWKAQTGKLSSYMLAFKP
jgi:polysaccharide biosynthesis protein PslH